MNIYKKTVAQSLAALFMVMAGTIELSAVPAIPTPIPVAQPDGSTLMVRLHGDENVHFTTTTDGYLLKRDRGGAYCYAVEDGLGNYVAGTLAAVNEEMRSASDRIALSGLNREEMVKGEIARLSAGKGASPLMVAAGSRASSSEAEIHRQTMFPTTPATGKPRLLVILVEYADKKFTSANPADLFNRQLNEKGFSYDGATGSVRDYFIASSNGAYEPTLDVYGPVRVSKNSAYYTRDNNSVELTVEACKLIDADVDLSVYDCDGDGVVDNVYIYYAGYGQADTGDESCIWPHSFKVFTGDKFDGKKLGNYTCSNELRGNSKSLAGIGTFCHEFSHALGLADLYAVNYSHNNTPGQWSLMDQGSYNNLSRTPPLHSVYERWVLGWLNPTVLSADRPTTYEMRPLTGDGYNDTYRFNGLKENEFFMAEVRRQEGWDSYIPGHGMIIWHVDFDRDHWMSDNANSYANDLGVQLVFDESSGYAQSSPYSSYPGAGKLTEVSLTGKDGRDIGIRLWDIKENSEGTVGFILNEGGFEASPTNIINAPDIDANRIGLSWKSVENVPYYLMTIAKKDGTPVVDNERVYGTEYHIELEELTQYTLTVGWIVGGKAQYSEIGFTTGWRPLSEFRIEALAAEDVVDNSFTARWTPLRDAETYTIEVWGCELTEGRTVKEDLTDKVFVNEGWENNVPFYTVRYGAAAPSLSFKDESNVLTSPGWERPIDKVTFYASSNNTSFSYATLIVMVADHADNWNEVYRCLPAKYSSKAEDKAAQTITLGRDVLGDDAWRVRFMILSGANWIVLDDIVIEYSENFDCTDVGIEPITTTNQGAYTVEGLKAGTTYAYRVTGHSSSSTSRSSDLIAVTTTGFSGIDDIVADGEDSGDSAWYTLTGLRLKGKPTTGGLYIHRRKVVRIP